MSTTVSSSSTDSSIVVGSKAVSNTAGSGTGAAVPIWIPISAPGAATPSPRPSEASNARSR
jgi:hypothetical protein